MNHLILENDLSVENSENENLFLKVESNPDQIPEKSNKIFTRHVGNKILKVLSPTDTCNRYIGGSESFY